MEQILEDRLKKIKTVLSCKAEEYATDVDRFHNFNVAANLTDEIPERALHGMMLKHIVSVLDLIKWAETGSGKLTHAIIDEKIGDNINYLILLEGLLKKRLNDSL